MLKGFWLGFAAFLLAGAAAAPEFDAFVYRQSHDAAFVTAELEALARGTDPHAPDAARADRMARLVLARAASSAAGYQASLRRVVDERRRLVALNRQLIEGPYLTEWLNSRWLNSAPGARDEFARTLFRRTFADQFHPEIRVQGEELRALRFLLAVDEARFIRENAEWLKTALARIGWFDMRVYGPEASQAAWLLVQHSDHDPAWQRSVLALLSEKVRSGDFQPNYFAYLSDRVAVNAHEPQRFGTQGHCAGPGDWQPFAVVAPAAELDSRRAGVGLEPIDRYRARFQCR